MMAVEMRKDKDTWVLTPKGRGKSGVQGWAAGRGGESAGGWRGIYAAAGARARAKG